MYKIGPKFFLKLEFQNQLKQFKLTCNSETKVFDNWEHATRYSPIYNLTSIEPPSVFIGKWFVIFLYRCRINELALLKLNGSVHVFASNGLANVVCFTQKSKHISGLINWAVRKGLKYEKWNLTDSIITRSSHSKYDNFKFDFKRLSPSNKVIKSLYFEYLSNFLSIYQNIFHFVPEYGAHFLQLNSKVHSFIESKISPDEEKIEFLISLNAGLSRLYGQTFSVCTNILYNYCPVQNHSLLGIGSSNLALLNFSRFYEKVIGEEFIPDKILELRKIDVDRELVYFKDDQLELSEFYQNEFINLVDFNGSPKAVPVVPFFSARDGFKSGNRINISVPLIAIFSCNTLSWNLLTLTHELSHLQVRGCLSHIWPDPNDEVEINYVKELLKDPKTNVRNYLDYAKELIGTAVIWINETNNGVFDFSRLKGKKLSPKFTTRLLIDIDETITHIFDFLYFYDGDINKYLRSIWASWITIPYIEDRIEDYIVRTGTAILSDNLHEKDWAKFVEVQLLKWFRILRKDSNHSYYKIALDHFRNKQFKKRIINKITARIPLIVFTRTFLYSTKISGKVNKELKVYSDHSNKEGYRLIVREFDMRDGPITNPFSFLNEFSKDQYSSEKNSLWILSHLSFITFKIGDK